MAEENEIVVLLERMVARMIPKSFLSTPPQKINVGMFNGGKGTGITHTGEFVDFTCHPLQNLSAGDVVIGVPIGPKLFYIVGTR